MAFNFKFRRGLLENDEGQQPQLPLIQVNEQGGLETDPLKMAQVELGLKQASTPLTMKDRVFGREMSQDYQSINPETNQVEMSTLTNYKPGLLNDIASGFRENYNQGFSAENLAPQGKGLATKIGEGLGTLARFYDKPIGRFAAAAGLSALTGEANPLGEGVTAYVGRQNNLTADRLYRNQLRQMGMSEEDLNAIPGNVTKDIFEGITSAMRYNNQRITWGQLAQTSPEIAEIIKQNPELADQFIPVNLARDIYGMKRETAKGKMEETKAKTEKTQAETKQVGKPKVNISIKKGGTTSIIKHDGGSGSNSSNSGSGRPRQQTHKTNAF